MRSSLEVSLLFMPLLASAMTMAQAGGQHRTLVINHKSGKVALMETAERTYVDLNRLVQISGGSISYTGNSIILDLPCSAERTAIPTNHSEEPKRVGLSRDFKQAAIEEISLMREWASTVANAVRNGYPVTESWVASYRARAQSGLVITSTRIANDADRSGFQLLNAEFERVQQWSSKLLKARESMSAANYAVSDALEQDPLSKQLVSCAHALGQMLATGDFQDEASCH